MLRTIRTTYREAFSGLPRPVWLLSFAQLVNRSGTMVLPFLTLWLTEERGFSTKLAGAALGLYGAGAMAGAWLGGLLVDRLSARRVMLLSLIGSGILFLALGRLRSPPAIFALVLALSVVGEALRPAAASALAQCALPGERARAYALNRLAINLGMTLGPTLGGFLALWSYEWLFLADGLTCLLAAATLRGMAGGERVQRPAERSDAAAARSPLRDGPYLVFLALMTLVASVVFQLNSTYPLYVHGELGYSEARLGLLLGANSLIIVLAEMVLVHRLRGVSPLLLVGPGYFLFGAGFALMPFGASFAWMLFTVAVWTAGEMLAFPLVESIAADRADEASRGRYMGLLTMSFGLAFMLGPVAGTWVYERFGADALWYGCGVAGALAWVAFAALRPALSRPSR